MKRYLFLTLLVGIFATGCAFVPTPQNANEWRAAIELPGGVGELHESYIVKQPYWKVVKTLKANTNKCLKNKRVESTSCGGVRGPGCVTKTFDYNPTFIKGNKLSELHVQVDISNTTYIAGKPPKGGIYVAVIDFLKMGKNKTKVSVYADNITFSIIPKTVKHWANQSNLGCPDLSKGF